MLTISSLSVGCRNNVLILLLERFYALFCSFSYRGKVIIKGVSNIIGIGYSIIIIKGQYSWYIGCYSFKGNPNSQGILNWIMQILHYYRRKQHKNIENSQIIGQSFFTSLWPSLCSLRLVLPSPSWATQFF